MKYLLIMFLLLPVSSFAGSGGMGPGPGFYVASGGGGPTVDYNETFDGTTMPSGWSENEGVGSVDWSNVGSVEITGNAGWGEPTITYSFSSRTEFYGAFEMYISEGASSVQPLIAINGSGGSVFRLDMMSDGSLRVYHGSGSTTHSLTADSTYFLWLEGTTSGGSDGVVNLYVSDTTTKPGTATLSITNGSDASTPIESVTIEASENNALILYEIWIDDEAIGSL